MTNSDFSFIVGIVFGVAVSFIGGMWAVHDSEILKAKRVCEQTIPRNQQCVYNWVPESSK